MKRKEILEKRLNRLETKKTSLAEKAKISQNADEVRAINEQLEELIAEINETKDEIESLNENRSMPPENAALVNGKIIGSFNMDKRGGDPYATLEYRQAFMKYAQTGTPIPSEFIQRDNAPTVTSDIGAIIPTTILNEFITKTKKVYGQIYNKVRKMNIRGGVKVPISDLSANFKWITETTVSPRQKAGEIKEFVEFSYNIGEIRVSQTLLSSIVSLDMFENEVVRIMLEAYYKAMDEGIIKGNGNGQMLGIVNDTRVTSQANHVVEMTAADMSDWTKWRKKLFALLPIAKKNGEFIFPVSTIESYLLTMADSNNNPIYKQATGLDENNKFFGREITEVEPEIISDFDTAAVGDVVGIYWTPSDYAVNTNAAFGMKRYFDEERNEWVNKLLTVVDGKILDPSGVYLIVKK